MNGVRTRQAAALRGATFRSVRWPPALAAVGLAAVLLSRWDGAFETPGSALFAVRTVVVLLALGTMFILDDDAAGTVAAGPTPLWWRRALRYGVAAAVVLPAWVGVLSYAHARRPELPVARLTLELSALVAVGLAVAAGATRWRHVPDPGIAAALAVLGLTVCVAHLPDVFALFTAPGSASWQWSTIRWVVVLVGAVMVLAAATRDPAVGVARR